MIKLIKLQQYDIKLSILQKKKTVSMFPYKIKTPDIQLKMW